ncbi:hypothetical protein H5410_027081 [Solanum commersonii]|uniref:Putative plant transposon protein domain-containing protein n=1 Tax=Solanum commersonii TaxID=4109 RepID=A0A9J5Z0A7_SOLCO|nr:hypothetical protein H5410_027081 [Solanum commersonii]
MPYGEDWYECQQESKYLGDEYVDQGRLRQEFPHIHTQIHALGLQYVFVDQGECNLSLVCEFYANWNTHHVKLNWGHTLCGVNSVARWDRVRDTGRHLTLHYGHFNLEVRICLKIMCITLLSCKHTTNVTREKVVLVYRLMKGLPMNVGAILKENMLKFRTKKRCHFCYGSIINRYLRALQIEKEVRDMCPPPHVPHLVCCLVDVTRTKAHDPWKGPMLNVINRQARDDSWMGCMFGMAQLQLRIGGHSMTVDEIVTLAECYPLTDSAMYLCWMGPTF